MKKRVRRENRAAGKEAEQKKPSKVTLFCRSLQRLKHLYCNINIQLPSITKKRNFSFNFIVFASAVFTG